MGIAKIQKNHRVNAERKALEALLNGEKNTEKMASYARVNTDYLKSTMMLSCM